MNIIENIGITYDDVLIVPSLSLPSRKDADTQTKFTKKSNIKIPIISANMSTITEKDMAIAMFNEGGVGILHRFMNLDEYARQIYEVGYKCGCVDFSIGIEIDKWLPFVLARLANAVFCKYQIRSITIDVAHGHSDAVINMIKELKRICPKEVSIIAGNIATKEAARFLCATEVDAIKTGIGNGGLCTTRLETGCGVAQITAISEVVSVAKQYGIPVIADGGIRFPGDIAKAIVAGASSIMTGALLAGVTEAPGAIIQSNGHKYKSYLGSASAYVKGQNASHVEGEGRMVEFTDCSLKSIIKRIIDGLTSGMSYAGCKTINELQTRAQLMRISPNVVVENSAHFNSHYSN